MTETKPTNKKAFLKLKDFWERFRKVRTGFDAEFMALLRAARKGQATEEDLKRLEELKRERRGRGSFPWRNKQGAASEAPQESPQESTPTDK